MLVALLAVVVTACGSGSSSTSSSTSETSPESSSTAASTANLVEQATTEAEKAMEVPSKWEGPTEPVEATKGTKLAVIACDAKLGGCTEAVKAMQQVAEEELGWSVKFYDGQSNPKIWNEAMEQAVNEGAEAIAIDSMPNQLVQPGLKAASEAGVPVISTTNVGFEPNPTIPSQGKPWPFVDVSAGYLQLGAATANLITSTTEGKANVLMLTDQTQDAVKAHEQGFTEQLEKICPECNLSELETSTTEVSSQTPQQTVAYLRAHPEIESVYVAYDPQALFLVPAIEQAGLATKVKVFGILGESPNLEFIRKGQVQVSDLAYDQHYVGWAMVDQLMRQLNGDKLSRPLNENVPWQLLTKENLPPATKESFQAKEIDYPQEYRKLWGVSK